MPTFLLVTRPVYRVEFADDVPVHERATIIIDGVERMARVSVEWRAIAAHESPDFAAWARGKKVRLVARNWNVEVWEADE